MPAIVSTTLLSPVERNGKGHGHGHGNGNGNVRTRAKPGAKQVERAWSSRTLQENYQEASRRGAGGDPGTVRAANIVTCLRPSNHESVDVFFGESRRQGVAFEGCLVDLSTMHPSKPPAGDTMSKHSCTQAARIFGTVKM